MQSTLATFQQDYEAFAADLADALAAADGFYDAVAGASGILTWIIENFDFLHATDELCGKSSPDWCNLGKGDWGNLASRLPRAPQLGGLDGLPTANSLWQLAGAPAVALAKDRLHDAAAATTDAAIAGATAALEAIRNSQQFDVGLDGPADYDPPQYPYANGNVTAEATNHSMHSQRLRTSLLLEAAGADAVMNATATPPPATQNISQATGTASRLAGATAAALFSSSAALQQYAAGAFEQLWARFSSRGVDYESWLAALLSLQGLLLLFDYLYRGLQSVRTVSRFWGRSVGTLPQADIQVTRLYCLLDCLLFSLTITITITNIRLGQFPTFHPW